MSGTGSPPLVDAGLRSVAFKTLRYPGHLDYMRLLLDDFGLRGRRDILRNLLLNGLPLIEDDVLLLVLTARGIRNGQTVEKTVCHRFGPNAALGSFNALTGVAAGYAATILLMLANGDLPSRGFAAHRQIDTGRILSGRFLSKLLLPGLTSTQY